MVAYACCSHCLIDCPDFADHAEKCAWGCNGPTNRPLYRGVEIPKAR